MKEKRLVTIMLMLITCIFLCSCDKKSQESTRELFAMDTFMVLKAHGEESDAALDEAVREIRRIDQMLSIGIKESEISTLNNNGEADFSEESMYLLDTSREVFNKTEGAFDITVYPLMVEWGFVDQKYRVPEKGTIKKLLENIGTDKIETQESNVKVPEGTKIDFGGIAKGYTSQKVIEILERHKVKGAIVSLGGNVQSCGVKADGKKYKVGIEDPKGSEDYIGVLEIKDKVVITSGSYERYFKKDGKVYHHIIDPKTGYPAKSDIASVTVVNEDGTTADAMATALFVMGREKALEYWKKYGEKDEFEMVIVENDGRITITEGLKETFDSKRHFKVVGK